MLKTTRKVGESIIINKNITVTILGKNGTGTTIGIDAPPLIDIEIPIQKSGVSNDNITAQ